MIVLDASVALKWIFGDEEGGEKAGPYKEGHVTGEETVQSPYYRCLTSFHDNNSQIWGGA